MCNKYNTFNFLSCLNLYLKFSPPSAMMCCSPPFKLETNLFKWLTSSTFHNSSSVYLSNGSKFRRRVPENNTGSYKNKTCKPRRYYAGRIWKLSFHSKNASNFLHSHYVNTAGISKLRQLTITDHFGIVLRTARWGKSHDIVFAWRTSWHSFKKVAFWKGFRIHEKFLRFERTFSKSTALLTG